jgi:N utilization substance protein B
MLFQWELSGAPPAEVERNFWKTARGSAELRFLANRMFEAAATDQPEADRLIQEHTEHWRLERLAAIDRGILRLAISELKRQTAPPAVIINEALELAHKFSEADAAGFINGVLDAVRRSLEQAAGESAP